MPRRRLPSALDVESSRFVSAIEHLTEIPPFLSSHGRPPDAVVDVIRGADLVALRVEVYGLELFGGEEPVLRTGDSDGHLVVHFSFQHTAERAIYEAEVLPPVPDDHSDPDGPSTATFNPPEQARPAKGSRLVFTVPAGFEITFTTEGILAAVSQLPMAVHPLARPRPKLSVIPQGRIVGLAPGVVAIPSASGLIIAPETSRRAGPDPSTIAGLTSLMRDRRIARAINARLGSVVTSRVDIVEPAGSATVIVAGNEVRIPGIVGTGGVIGRPPNVTLPRRPKLSREPRQFETAIEAPYRLIISPSALGGWAHATTPVAAPTDTEHEEQEGQQDTGSAERRVELWHSRLGVRSVDEDDTVTIDQVSSYQRAIRGIWARDREAMNWRQEFVPPHADLPFRSSLDGADRHMIVRQSAETWLGDGNEPIHPDAVEARRLYLSSVGAWLDLHGKWTTLPYSEADPEMSSIESWDHIAPMGRDQFVKVVYPGYLWPFGHRASLVKLTERKMKTASNSVAGLYQRKFLVVKEPVKSFHQSDLPFTEVRISPIVTPTLNPDPGDLQNSAFMPKVDNTPFAFILHCRDHEDREVKLTTPLTWVAEHFDTTTTIQATHSPFDVVFADGQQVAFAPASKGGDTIAPTARFTFDAEAHIGGSTPTMVDADITIDAVERLSSVGSVTIKYFDTYLSEGFDGAGNKGEVWAELLSAEALSFGAQSSSGSDKAGGFIQPDLTVAGLSRAQGVVNDLVNVADETFDPLAFLSGVAPKLFGLVDLVDLLKTIGVDLSDAPSVVSDTLGRIEAFIADLERAKKTVQDAVVEADKLVTRAQGKTADLQNQAQAALAAAQNLDNLVSNAVDDILNELTGLLDATETEVQNALANPLTALSTALNEVPNVAPLLPPLVRKQLESLARVLRQVLDAVDLIDEIVRFVNGLAGSNAQFSYRYEWVPKLESWPSEADPVLKLTERSLVIAVEGRVSGKGDVGVEALAELKDFSLILLPGTELVAFKFDHLSFNAGSSGKAEVDVVLNDIEFLGLLGFIEVLKELIPFDGFSDPPYLDVTAAGLTAGFTIDLPNVAVGVFNMSNLSLGADVQVPFLGETVTVGFSFCTRERPFVLAVSFIGGGGFFGLRLSPKGLVVLELSLEAGAILAVDFGVASGSISAMLGIYMRLEGDGGALAGYFRLRGEVDVLGLISASIELYLELNYDFDTGKMVGKARLTIKVEVLFFSASVTIEAERQFAGSNGDPNFIDVMVEDDGTSPAWSQYCLAFAGS
ncbi:MAG: hypothetical protein ABFR95_05450 [Actinomycetota bacterium]